MAVCIEAFDISKVAVTPFTKREVIKNNYKVIFMTNIKYNYEPFKLQVNDIILNKYCIPTYINPKTEMPNSKYIYIRKMIQRDFLCVPVINKLKKVLDSINMFIDGNVDNIMTYNTLHKIFLSSYKPEYTTNTGYTKNPYFNAYFRYDNKTNKITTKIYEIQEDGTNIQKDMTFKEIEDKFHNLTEATSVSMILSLDKLWMNKEDTSGIKIFIDELTL